MVIQKSTTGDLPGEIVSNAFEESKRRRIVRSGLFILLLMSYVSIVSAISVVLCYLFASLSSIHHLSGHEVSLYLIVNDLFDKLQRKQSRAMVRKSVGADGVAVFLSATCRYSLKGFEKNLRF